MPLNTTAKIQPQDQGIIAAIKKKFKTVFLRLFFAFYAKNRFELNIRFKFFETIAIKDIIYILADIWANLPKSTLTNACHNLGINTLVEAELEVPSLPFQTLIPTAEINEWLSDEEIDPGWAILNDYKSLRFLKNFEFALYFYIGQLKTHLSGKMLIRNGFGRKNSACVG